MSFCRRAWLFAVACAMGARRSCDSVRAADAQKLRRRSRQLHDACSDLLGVRSLRSEAQVLAIRCGCFRAPLQLLQADAERQPEGSILRIQGDGFQVLLD